MYSRRGLTGDILRQHTHLGDLLHVLDFQLLKRLEICEARVGAGAALLSPQGFQDVEAHEFVSLVQLGDCLFRIAETVALLVATLGLRCYFGCYGLLFFHV